MSVSAIFGTRVPMVGNIIGGSGRTVSLGLQPANNVGVVIECSSRPQKKATAHHRKTRPKKTQPWDIKRRPTVYAPLPPLPADWTLVSDDFDSSSSTPESQSE